MLLLQDISIYFKIFSWKKFLNFFLLKSSFYLSKILRKPIVWGKPMAISIEPTTACNLECPACPSGLKIFSRPTGNMKSETFEKIINQLHPYLFHINFYFQGEPLIHPKIFEWIHHAQKNNIYTHISTNAHFLDKENCEKLIRSGLHKMIISIDGMTQDSYQQYRKKGNIDKVLEGIENLLQTKQKLNSTTPILILQWIAFKHNMHELEKFKRFCKEKKLNYQIKTAQVYSEDQLKTLVPEDENYSRYDLRLNEIKIKGRIKNDCWRMWASCVFTQDGIVVPCCFDKDAKYEMGDIKTQHFDYIWKSKEYYQFREKILHSRTSIDICNNCSEGAKVFSD
ncbi:MAG: radical SAM domain protein [Bacteroidia bacterium]|nr:MAG: radical SAM domain protein [Bacteroidia bacterium]